MQENAAVNGTPSLPMAPINGQPWAAAPTLLFTEERVRELVEALEEPFEVAEIKWRVTNTSQIGSRNGPRRWWHRTSGHCGRNCRSRTRRGGRSRQTRTYCADRRMNRSAAAEYRGPQRDGARLVVVFCLFGLGLWRRRGRSLLRRFGFRLGDF